MIKNAALMTGQVIQTLGPGLGKDCTWESPPTRAPLGNLGLRIIQSYVCNGVIA